MPKQIDLHLEARRKLLQGARLLAKTTAVTYGPKGRTVMLDRAAGLMATKDGVTVAREIDLADHVENLGAQTLKEACVKVNDRVGDGTTTAAIIGASLMEGGYRLAAAGMDPMRVVRGIQDAAREAIRVVEDMAVPVESQVELERVAYVASNGDVTVAAALAEACMAVGKDGTISVEDGHGVDIELIFKDGMEIDKGAVSPAFLRETGGNERPMDSPLVAVIGARLSTVEDVQQVLEESSQWPNNDLILLGVTIEGPALTTMLVNDAKQVVMSCGIPAPGFGDKRIEYLKDIAALAGATFVDPDIGMDFKRSFDPDWFGSFRKATVKARSALFIAYEEAQEVIGERIEELRRGVQSTSSDYDRDRLTERIAKLSGGLCVMQVGGPTEMVLKERRARVEDALGAVRGALEEGVVPGGGSAYLTASEVLSADPKAKEQGPDYAAGWAVFVKALRTPLWWLAHNAGKDGSAIIHQVLGDRENDPYGWMGWDAVSDEIRDLSDIPPILDPTMVATTVIEAAASVAATLLTAEVSITEIEG